MTVPRSRRLARIVRVAGGERGAGLIATIAGVVVFLAFLLGAVQVTVNLYATSAVTAAAYDGARIVSGSDSPRDREALRRAERHVRETLGGYGDRVRLAWRVDGTTVALRVRARNPVFVLPVLGGAFGFDEIDRTVRVRVERVR